MEGSSSDSTKMSKVGGKKSKPPPPPPLVRPQPQYRRPVIIHTYSPKIIEADPASFMWLVQRLTGSSDTRIRCESCKPAVLPKDMPDDDGPARKKLKTSSSSSSTHKRQQQQQQTQRRVSISPIIVKAEEQLQEQQQQQPAPHQILLSPSSSSDSGILGGRPTAASPKSPLQSYAADPSQDDHHQEQQQAYLVPTEVPWSSMPPTPSPDFLTELSSIFEGFNSNLDGFTMFSASPRFPLQSPATLAHRDWALAFAKDTATF